MEKSRLRNVKDNALLENRTGPTSEYLQNQQGIKAKTNMLTTGKRSLLPWRRWRRNEAYLMYTCVDQAEQY